MRSLLPILLAAALAGCGSADDGPAITDSDREAAAEQHPQLLAEFGGAYQGDEAAYLTALGGRIATAAGLADQCTFTLVNSDVVNAFAVPGCYIYVTGGLMGISTARPRWPRCSAMRSGISSAAIRSGRSAARCGGCSAWSPSAC